MFGCCCVAVMFVLLLIVGRLLLLCGFPFCRLFVVLLLPFVCWVLVLLFFVR